MAGSLDVSQVGKEFTSMLPIVSPDVRDADLDRLDNQAFAGFTFVDESSSNLLAQAQQSMMQQASFTKTGNLALGLSGNKQRS